MSFNEPLQSWCSSEDVWCERLSLKGWGLGSDQKADCLCLKSFCRRFTLIVPLQHQVSPECQPCIILEDTSLTPGDSFGNSCSLLNCFFLPQNVSMYYRVYSIAVQTLNQTHVMTHILHNQRFCQHTSQLWNKKTSAIGISSHACRSINGTRFASEVTQDIMFKNSLFAAGSWKVGQNYFPEFTYPSHKQCVNGN